MIHLQIHSEMRNSVRTSNKIQWSFPHLEFAEDSKVSLSSLTIDFTDNFLLTEPLKISTNLIEGDTLNPDGMLITFPSGLSRVSHFATFLEFWKIDSVRPRNITFTFEGVSTDSLNYVSAVLAIQNNA